MLVTGGNDAHEESKHNSLRLFSLKFRDAVCNFEVIDENIN